MVRTCAVAMMLSAEEVSDLFATPMPRSGGAVRNVRRGTPGGASIVLPALPDDGCTIIDHHGLLTAGAAVVGTGNGGPLAAIPAGNCHGARRPAAARVTAARAGTVVGLR